MKTDLLEKYFNIKLSPIKFSMDYVVSYACQEAIDNRLPIVGDSADELQDFSDIISVQCIHTAQKS